MIISGRRVSVKDGNVEKALRKFKKKVNDSKVLQDYRERQEYVKPTTKKKVAKSAAKKRWERKRKQLDPIRYRD